MTFLRPFDIPLEVSHSSLPPRPGQRLDDPGRLAALRQSGLMDAEPEPTFDRHTELVRRALKCDVSLMSLVDDTHQSFKSLSGVSPPECFLRGTPLSHSFCQYVVTTGQPLHITDAREHPLVRDNLAISDLGVVAYLGTPLATDDGFVLGSLCAISSSAKQWTEDDQTVLNSVAEAVISEIRWRSMVSVLRDLVESREAVERKRDELIHALVHDMRSPLSAVITSLDLLKDGLTLDAEQQELFGIAEQTGHQLLDMLNGMLEVNRLEEGEERPDLASVPVSSLLRQAFRIVKPLAETAGHEFLISYLATDLTVQADPNLINRLLINLLTNAIKFCPAGCTLELRADRDEGGVRFSVRDNGPGIREEEKMRIFEKFHRGTSAVTGSSFGMGLAFCWRVVAAHGGTIRLADVPGGGCDFSFVLPESVPVAG